MEMQDLVLVQSEVTRFQLRLNAYMKEARTGNEISRQARGAIRRSAMDLKMALTSITKN